MRMAIAQTSSHVSYSKADGDHIGNSWSDSYGSGSSFIVEKTTSTTTTAAAETVNIAVTGGEPVCVCVHWEVEQLPPRIC